MHVESVWAKPATGSPTELGQWMEGLAKKWFLAPGCYGAYSLRDAGDGSFTCISFWVSADAFRKAFPTGVEAPGGVPLAGQALIRSYESTGDGGPKTPIFTYVGIRVTDIDRSLRFYTTLFGFEPIGAIRENPELHSKNVMLRNPRSGQQIELNWYPPGSRFGVPFIAGEALDHIGVRVPNVPDLLEKAKELGGEPADFRPFREFPFHTDEGGLRLAYLLDPDGNQVEIYDIPRMELSAPFGGEY